MKIRIADDSLTRRPKLKLEHHFEKESQVTEYLQSLLIKLYQQGNITATIDTITVDSTNYSTLLSIGKSYNWVKLEKGNVDEDILNAVNFYKRRYRNKKFKYKEIAALFRKILHYTENHGNPFAEIKLDSIIIIDKHISAKLKLTKKSSISFDSLEVKGSARIKKKFLYNYLGFKYNGIYNEKKVVDIEKKLNELPFIYLKESPEIVFESNKAKVNLKIDKKNANSFNGILGINPSNDQTKKVSFNGLVDLLILNPLSRGMSIGINWNKTMLNTQNLAIKYKYPYLLNLPIGIDFKFNILKQDTFYMNIKSNIGISYFISASKSVNIFYENISSSIISSNLFSNIDTLHYLDADINNYGIEINFANLDYKLNPRKGYLLSLQTKIGEKKSIKNSNIKNEVFDSLNIQSLISSSTLNFSYFIPIGKNSAFMLGAKCGLLFDNNAYKNELFRIGGRNSVRGYDDESILANNYLIGQVEYRYLVEKNSFFQLFCDLGVYENRFKKPMLSYPLGFGIGYNFKTKAGIFHISYGIGMQTNGTTYLKSGTVYFGLSNIF